MFEVERVGKLVLFPNLFRIGVFEIVPQPGSAMCDVHVHVDGTKVIFNHFGNKEEARKWVLEKFKFEEPAPLPVYKEEDPFAKKKKKPYGV
jgi:hypothetical protein